MILIHWNDLIDTGPHAPQWQVSVLPVSARPAVTNVAYDSANALGDVPMELSNIVTSLPSTPAIVPSNPPTLAGHPKAETLMTIIASQLYQNKERSSKGQPEINPIDSETWTWAEGNINSGAFGLAVYWVPGFGQVYLYYYNVRGSGNDSGVRPEVRG